MAAIVVVSGAPRRVPSVGVRVDVAGVRPFRASDTTGVVACESARGAATATGNRLEVKILDGASPSMRPNLALAALYRNQLDRLGLEETPHQPSEAIGSSDITHVSRVVPTIHPNFPIGSDLKIHSREFAEAVASPQAEAGMLEAARALALTAHEFARCEKARRAVAAGGADS